MSALAENAEYSIIVGEMKNIACDDLDQMIKECATIKMDALLQLSSSTSSSIFHGVIHIEKVERTEKNANKVVCMSFFGTYKSRRVEGKFCTLTDKGSIALVSKP